MAVDRIYRDIGGGIRVRYVRLATYKAKRQAFDGK